MYVVSVCGMQGVLPLLLLPHAACLVLPGPLRQVYYDWVALNARSTTRHIMKPLTTAGREELLLLKQQVRADVTSGSFVVDAFASAAAVSSIDEESCQNGGLIGRRLRQGVCILPELDRACFTAPLGEVAGPLRSSEGYHLVLVEERLGLAMHDGGNTRVVAEPAAGEAGERGGVRSVLKPADPADDGNELLSPVSVVTLVVSLLVVGVLGDAITTVASSIAPSVN